MGTLDACPPLPLPPLPRTVTSLEHLINRLLTIDDGRGVRVHVAHERMKWKPSQGLIKVCC